jgi:hypothetical protein
MRVSRRLTRPIEIDTDPREPGGLVHLAGETYCRRVVR